MLSLPARLLEMRLLASFCLFTLSVLTACSPAAPPAVIAPPTPTVPAPTQEAAPVLVTPKAVPPPLPTQSEPKVYAQSALAVDAVTGRILFQKNAHAKRAVASTQKLLTALVVYRAGPLEDPVKVTKEDTLVEPSKLYLKAGEIYPRHELIKALLVKSGNDVAKALARDVSGSEAAFVDLMNRTAKELGMHNSHFKNPHGLTETGQYSTAHDLAILARAVQQIPFLRQCMKVKNYTFTYPSGRTRDIRNTNEILHQLAFCTGMKTGTTRASGKCLVASGTLNGRSVITIALGSKDPDVWNDTEKMLRYTLE